MRRCLIIDELSVVTQNLEWFCDPVGMNLPSSISGLSCTALIFFERSGKMRWVSFTRKIGRLLTCMERHHSSPEITRMERNVNTRKQLGYFLAWLQGHQSQGHHNQHCTKLLGGPHLDRSSYSLSKGWGKGCGKSIYERCWPDNYNKL